MSMNSVVSPFRRLLNSISNDLSPQNLQSLIHICGCYIPESRREKISSGLDVFHILIQQDLIGDDLERLRQLEQIVKTMRPKRKDIIGRVEEYIRKNHKGYDFLSSSSESCGYCQGSPAILVENNHHEPRSLDRKNSSGLVLDPSVQHNPFLNARPFSRENHCSMDCCCWGCNCYTHPIPSCVLLVLAVIMAALTFFSCLLWYEGIPHTLYSRVARSPDGIKAGGYLVGIFGAATIGILIWWMYRKVRGHHRHVGQIPYEGFSDEYPMNFFSNVAEKAPIAPPNPTIHSKKQKRRPLGSASSSPDLQASASILERDKKHRRLASKRLGRPRRYRKSRTEEGELQIEGIFGPGRSDDEALVTV